MRQLWRVKKYKVYSEKRLFLHYCLQLHFVYNSVFQISFNVFCSGNKRLLKARFCKWKSTNNNDINIFLSLEKPCTFLFAKEKTWKCIINTNSELSENRTEKQIIPSKTTVNYLFNDIWCYLFTACFHWKIGVFQQLSGFIISLNIFFLYHSAKACLSYHLVAHYLEISLSFNLLILKI